LKRAVRFGSPRSVFGSGWRSGVRPVADAAWRNHAGSMAVELYCRSCGRQLTQSCEWVSEPAYDRKSADRKPPVPKGVLIGLNADDVVDMVQGGEVVGQRVHSRAGALAANPEDLLTDVLHSTGIDNGCCGSDGIDGPNRACTCGAVVATEWSDCWTQAEVRFLPDAVALVDAPEVL